VPCLTAGTRRSPITSAGAWTAADVSETPQWTTRLSPRQRADIGEAARAVEKNADVGHDALHAAFDLPSLRSDVADWVAGLRDGRGFVLVRDFPVDDLSPRQTELAYVGLGLQMGTPVSQNAAGDYLGHVRDEGVERTDPSVRLYQTRQRQDFHTDVADIVGLLCLQTAKRGDKSRIASSGTVYNRILAERPDLLELLYQPMCRDRNGEERIGEDSYFALPVISDVGGSPRIFFIGWYIRDAQRHAGAPRLTAEQAEAIELVECIANDEYVCLETDVRPGDIRWLANDRILHSREAYEDHPDPLRRRHLLRLWLAARTFADVDDVLRGGIPPKDGGNPGSERS
jgi:Taurine catabolism dioxygenase TauD, TfdA family